MFFNFRKPCWPAFFLRVFMKKFIILLISCFTLNSAFALPWNAPDPSVYDILNAWLNQTFDNLMKYMGPEAVIQDLNDGGKVVQYYKSSKKVTEGHYGPDYYTEKKDYKTGITYHEYHKGDWIPGSEETYEGSIRFTINKAQKITMWKTDGNYSELKKIIEYPPNFDFYAYYQEQYTNHAQYWLGVDAATIDITYPKISSTDNSGNIVVSFSNDLYIKFIMKDNHVESLQLVNKTGTPNAFKDNYRDPDAFEVSFAVGGGFSVWTTPPNPKFLCLYAEGGSKMTGPGNPPLEVLAGFYLDRGLGDDLFRINFNTAIAYTVYKKFYVAGGLRIGGTFGEDLSGFNLGMPIYLGLDFDIIDLRYNIYLNAFPVKSIELGLTASYTFKDLIK